MKKGAASFEDQKGRVFLLPDIGGLVFANYRTRYGRNPIPKEGAGFGIR
jgi:hypothetical protein